jgi:hypothetical protein
MIELYILIIIILLLILIINKKEKFSPNYCSPFIIQDMYSKNYSCSDPFKWGFLYSTGKCPKAYI